MNYDRTSKFSAQEIATVKSINDALTASPVGRPLLSTLEAEP